MAYKDLTEKDINDLKGSWGEKWRDHISGKAVVMEKAIDLLNKLKGNGWKIEVFENLGWHYHLKNWPFSVSEYDGQYSVLMTSDPSFLGSGEMFWSDDFRSEDPNEVVNHQLEVAREFAAKINNAIAEAEKSIRVPDCNTCKCKDFCIAEPGDKRCGELRSDNGL